MKRILFTIGFVLVFCLSSSVKAQVADTIIIDSLPKHSPAKATIMSLAVPGLGQAYNKKYWKIPVVYALIGTPLYFALKQRESFEDFKDAYITRNVDMQVDKYDGVYTNQQLLSLIDYHRKNRDLFFVLTGVAYALNVVDAAVDAHLYYFDVSDDLAGNIRPTFQYSAFDRQPVPSLTLSLKFAKKSHIQAF